jgi:hypothetical protein
MRVPVGRLAQEWEWESEIMAREFGLQHGEPGNNPNPGLSFDRGSVWRSYLACPNREGLGSPTSVLVG